MVDEDTLNDALEYLRTTQPLSRCGIEDILGAGATADIRLGLHVPLNEGVTDFFESCKQTLREHQAEEYQFVPRETHHMNDDDGTPYFYVTVKPNGDH